MNLDDLMKGSLNLQAETLPKVYGFDDDSVVEKVRQLIEASLNSDKDHEVIEMCKALSDSDDEALVLLMLVNKFFYAKAMKDIDSTLSELAIGINMSIMRLLANDTLTDEQAMAVAESISNTLDSLMDD